MKVATLASVAVALIHEPKTITELSRETELSRHKVYKCLHLMSGHGHVSRDENRWTLNNTGREQLARFLEKP